MASDKKITVVNMKNHKMKSRLISLLTKINYNRIQAAANSRSKSTTLHQSLGNLTNPLVITLAVNLMTLIKNK
jgi:hypothetical protein